MNNDRDINTPKHSAGQWNVRYTNVVGILMVPQVLVSAFAVFAVAFERGQSCESRCAYDVDWAAQVTLWIAVGIITALTLAGLIAWRRRGWRSWPVAFLGVALTALAAFVAGQVVDWAYQP